MKFPAVWQALDFPILTYFKNTFPEKVIMWNTFLTKTYSVKYLLLGVSNFWLLLPYTQGRMLQEKNIVCTPERYLKRSLGENNISKR